LGNEPGVAHVTPLSIRHQPCLFLLRGRGRTEGPCGWQRGPWYRLQLEAGKEHGLLCVVFLVWPWTRNWA
jgi:hypothetical protein